VARIMRTLRGGGLVASTRGAAGGYHLPRPPDQISVGEAIRALGGEFFSEESCVCRPGRRRDCIHLGDCSVRALWAKLASELRRTREQISQVDLRRDECSMTTWLDSMLSPATGLRPGSGS
jgi:Rrf2 family protein